jgi:hypothetical protein
VIIGAWNELDEGHWIMPSLLNGTQKLEAVRKGIQQAHAEAASLAVTARAPDPGVPTFQPCNNSDLQKWAMTGTKGVLQPANNLSLCLTPKGCAGSIGASPVVAKCSDVTRCGSWTYDTFTFFTFTNDASGLLLESDGSGTPATLGDSGVTMAKRFIWGDGSGTIKPATDSTICLTHSY